MTDKALEKIKQAAFDHVSGLVDGVHEDSCLGETPIERLFYTALKVRVWLGASEYTHLIDVADINAEKRAFSDPEAVARPTLIIRPQAQLDGWRVDFLIHAFDFARLGGRQRWRPLIVECDGHDFHERTKAQAARDRSRDREFQLLDYSVLRFTGSELYRDAWACAAQVTDWAVKGFP